MNPGYMNPAPGQYGQPPMGPPQGYGPPPGMQPPGAGYGQPPPPGQGLYNGTSMPPQRPPMSQGGYGGPPPPGAKQGMSQPPSMMQNGPQPGGQFPGPQGEQFGRPPGPGVPPGGGMTPPLGQAAINGPPQTMGPPPMRGPPPNVNQVSNQMAGMNMSGTPQPNSMAGMPPPSSQAPGQMGGPRPPMMNAPPMGPPSSMGPPASMGPPTSMGPPMSMGPPTSMGPPQTVGPPFGMPPSSMAGPPSSMSGPPTSMGSYPNSVGAPPLGGPPNSMAGLPPSMNAVSGPPPPMGGPSMPPSSMAGPPMMNSMAGPPNSMAGPPPMGMSHMNSAGPPQMPMGGPPPQNIPGSIPPLQLGPNAMQQPGNQFVQQPYQEQPPPSPGTGGPPYPPPPGPAGYNASQRPGAPQAPRRLDPDQMPNPIQVTEDDNRNRCGPYQTGQRGVVPPLVTTQFTVEDQGICSPRFIRSTMYNVPISSDMMKQAHIPFILNIAPFATLAPDETPPPLVDLGELGPVRCNRCKAYMNPFMQFIDGGRRFQCCFCSCATEVPPEYFNHLDHTGRRIDTYDRPELCLGTYDMTATKDYCKNGQLPKPPAYIFMIDVSYNSVKSGFVNLICDRLKEDILPHLPKEPGMEESEVRVGFVTYAKQLHFYNVKNTLVQPQMLVVSDIQDVFVPLLDGFLVKPSESEAVIDSLLAQIPQMFADSRETEIVLGPVIQAGLDALKSAECPGKLYIFHSSLPIADAPGKLKNRDDRKLLGTEKEKTILTPAIPFYTTLGQDCVTAGCSVDLFLFPNSYIDIASMSEVPRLTGGQVYKYTYFQADLDGDRFIDDLRQNIQRPIGFDAIMRVRTSTGIRPVDFMGNFYMSNTTDIELAAVDCDKSITIEVKHDDKLNESEGAYIQAAILYTSVAGARRLRIMNLALNCCSQMADLFRNCELDTLINHMAKIAIRGTLNNQPKIVRENIMNQCAQILACYRKNCASPSSAGQLILPECMKLLPVYSNCIIKSTVLQGGSEIMTDDRSFLFNVVNGMNVRDTQVFFYPRLLPLHDLPKDGSFPRAIRCSYERLQESGIYLLENGLTLYLWIGIAVSPEWVQNVFGVQSAAQIDIDKTTIQELDNPLSRRVRDIIKQVREERHRHMKLIIVRQRDKLEPVFQQYLMEDHSSNGSASYVEYLCYIHKEIRTLLS